MANLAYAPTPASDPAFDQRWKMCFRKVAFYTEAEATKRARAIKKMRTRTVLRVYECPVLSPRHWHLTHRAEWHD